MRVDVTRAAGIHYRCGSSGSGKSWGVKESIKSGARRLIIFDPDDEYSDYVTQTVKTVSELGDWIRRYPRGALKIRLVGNGAKIFDGFCKLAFIWGDCVVVAEELSGVTSPNKAPAGWHTLVSRGRKRGIVVYAVTQRPSEADKTCIGNATTIRTGRLSRAGDRKYLAAEMDLDVSYISALNNLDFIQTNMNNMQSIAGNMKTPRRRKVIRE